MAPSKTCNSIGANAKCRTFAAMATLLDPRFKAHPCLDADPARKKRAENAIVDWAVRAGQERVAALVAFRDKDPAKFTQLIYDAEVQAGERRGRGIKRKWLDWSQYTITMSSKKEQEDQKKQDEFEKQYEKHDTYSDNTLDSAAKQMRNIIVCGHGFGMLV